MAGVGKYLDSNEKVGDTVIKKRFTEAEIKENMKRFVENPTVATESVTVESYKVRYEYFIGRADRNKVTLSHPVTTLDLKEIDDAIEFLKLAKQSILEIRKEDN